MVTPFDRRIKNVLMNQDLISEDQLTSTFEEYQQDQSQTDGSLAELLVDRGMVEPNVIISEVTTKYDPATDQLTQVSIVHDETVFSETIDANGNGAKELILQYPFPSDVCPACSDRQPVLVWSDEVEPVVEWSDRTDIDVVRA